MYKLATASCRFCSDASLLGGGGELLLPLCIDLGNMVGMAPGFKRFL